MKKTIYMLTVAVAGLTMASCQHKELCYDHSHIADLKVVFDWQKAPDADPESMALFLFPEAGGETQRYEFASREGGSARVSVDRYNGICLNSDNTDWVQYRGKDRYETFEVYTYAAEVLTGNGFPVGTLPHVAATSSERVALAPGELWCDRGEHYDLSLERVTSGILPTVTMYPEEAVCHYSVEFTNVRNLQYLRSTVLDVTLSGMAEGYLPALARTSDTQVTFPFEGTLLKEENKVEGSFLTFGDCATTETRHYLTIYMILTDQSKWYMTYEVTDQIHNAADPKNVHIVIDGLELPKPITGGDGSDGGSTGGGGGLQPDIDDWQPAIEVPIPM